MFFDDGHDDDDELHISFLLLTSLNSLHTMKTACLNNAYRHSTFMWGASLGNLLIYNTRDKIQIVIMVKTMGVSFTLLLSFHSNRHSSWRTVLHTKLSPSSRLEITHFLWNLWLHYHVHNSPSLILIQRKLNPVQNLTSCFLYDPFQYYTSIYAELYWLKSPWWYSG
jgi:hypothetical protein